jgi:hypothetical protein
MIPAITTISGVAWAPDSKVTAILKDREYFKWWQPIDILSYIMGHPIAHMEFALDVHDLKTTTVAHTLLVKDLPSGAGEVVWIE